MGCEHSAQIEGFDNFNILPANSGSKWKSKKTKRETLAYYIEEGSLPEDADDNLLQLRVYLEEPSILKDICNYAKQTNKLHLLICWSDTLEFKAIPPLAFDLVASHMQHVYHKYIKNEGVKIVLPNGYANEISQKVNEFSVILETATEDGPDEAENKKLSPELKTLTHLFDVLQQQCLLLIYNEVFVAYRSTTMFISKKKFLDADVNRIKPDDFEYFDILGQGAFGCVVHCRKKSTGKHYAMKIQTKLGMLDNFHDCPERVVLEKDGIASCMHPFIIGMDYAFQSRELTFMAMDLGEEGTLRDAMDNSHRGVLPLIRVQFYSAEIFLALAHMHRLGLIYRDLKPHNVILNRDGHIRLVDMGGIVDVGGKICGYHGNEEIMGGLFAADYKSTQVPSKEASAMRAPNPPVTRIGSKSTIKRNKSDSKKSADSATQRKAFSSESTFKMSTVKPKRANSIMGTNGYMAPEMLIMETQRHHEKIGYTSAVDYWSLGVMMFKLLTNSLPFKNRTVAEFAIYYANLPQRVVAPAGNGNGNGGSEKSATLKPHALDVIEETLKLCPNMTSECISIISGFLEVREERRLGYGSHGVNKIKCHPFYSNIKWSLMSQKFMDPPYIPPKKVEVISDDPYSSFYNMMLAIDKYEWIQCTVVSREQKYFDTWDYISPTVVAIEMDLEEAKENSNAHFVETSTGRVMMPMTPIMESLNSVNNHFSFAEGTSPPLSQKPLASSLAVTNILEEIQQ